MAAISTFKTFYYSGSQAEIYFHDVFIDEMTSLQFSTVTNRTPIYGYASQLFDTVANGNLLIRGSFAINFVQAQYLNIIALMIKEGSGFVRGELGQSGSPNTPVIDAGYNAFLPFKGAVTEYKEMTAVKNLSTLSKEEWMALGPLTRNESIAQRNKSEFQTHVFVDRFDKIPKFDIFAIFGDYRNPEAQHTVRKIKDVYLVGQAQSVISNGEPIQEVYEFIARDIE